MQRGCWHWDVVQDEFHLAEDLRELIGGVQEHRAAGLDAFLQSVETTHRDRVHAWLETRLRGGPSASIDYSVVLPSGELRHLRMRGELVRGPRGEAVRVFGALMDVTAQVRADDALKASESLRRVADRVRKNLAEHQSGIQHAGDEEGS